MALTAKTMARCIFSYKYFFGTTLFCHFKLKFKAILNKNDLHPLLLDGESLLGAHHVVQKQLLHPAYGHY
jgi:hypothetical protein